MFLGIKPLTLEFSSNFRNQEGHIQTEFLFIFLQVNSGKLGHVLTVIQCRKVAQFTWFYLNFSERFPDFVKGLGENAPDCETWDCNAVHVQIG